MIPQNGTSRFPNLTKGASPIHQADQLMRLGGKSVVLTGEAILYYIPIFSTVAMTVNLHMAA
jgi:hypothetical protein